MEEKIIQNIKTDLSEDIIKLIIDKLKTLKYQFEDGDETGINFAINKIDREIKNFCNITIIPNELLYVFIDRVCGEFLSSKRAIGSLEIDGVSFSSAITSIKEGDTQINYNGGDSTSSLVNNLIDNLRYSGKEDLLCFRKLSW